MAEAGPGRVEQLAAEPAPGGQLAHQQEERQHRQGVARHPAERRGVEQVEKGRPAGERCEAKAADCEHGHRHRHPQPDQQQADGEENDAEFDMGHRWSVRR